MKEKEDSQKKLLKQNKDNTSLQRKITFSGRSISHRRMTKCFQESDCGGKQKKDNFFSKNYNNFCE